MFWQNVQNAEQQWYTNVQLEANVGLSDSVYFKTFGC